MKKCYICKRSRRIGNKVSHSQRKTKRKFNPNLHQDKIRGKKVLVCSKCRKKMEYLLVL